MDEKYFRLRDFVREHPTSTIDEIQTGTGLTLADVISFVKEDSLALTSSTHPSIASLVTCRVCRTAISSGVLCNECKRKQTANNHRPLETNMASRKRL